MTQHLGFDVLTLISSWGVDGDVEVGTAVIPVQTRHPVVLAEQALTAQALCGGRLALGLGLAHADTLEGVYRLSRRRSVSYLSDYLSTLDALMAGKRATPNESFALSTRIGAAELPTPPPVLIAALGPRMLQRTRETVLIGNGSRWPGGRYGEVEGPRGQRSYLPEVAGDLVGKSARWARSQVQAGRVRGESEAFGHRRVFLDAESFEALAASLGKWPPPTRESISNLDDADSETWQRIAIEQERQISRLSDDLAQASVELAALQEEFAHLRRDREQLLQMIEQLSSIARRP